VIVLTKIPFLKFYILTPYNIGIPWSFKPIIVRHYLLPFFSLQQVHYNTTFYVSPVVLVSVHHQYDRKAKTNIPPENNIITVWVEVRYVPEYSPSALPGSLEYFKQISL